MIAIRNNVKCGSYKARIRSHRYQVFEKFVLAPLMIAKKMLSQTLLAISGSQ